MRSEEQKAKWEIRRVNIALAGVVVWSASLPLWLSNQSGFFSDDFFHLWMHKAQFSWRDGYLTQEFFGHMIVTQKLLYHLLFLGTPPTWFKVQTGMVGANVLLTVLGYRIGRRLHGHSLWSVACAAVVGLSCYQANAWVWSAAATDYLAYAPFALLAVDLMVKRCMHKSSRWITLGIGLLISLALVGHERSAVLAPGLLFLAIALFPRPLSEGRRLTGYLMGLWDVWVVCTVVVSGFLFFLFKNNYFSGQLPGSGSTSATADPWQMAKFFWVAFTQTLLPGFLGVFPNYYFNSFLFMIVALGLLFAVILGCIVFFPRSARAWAMLGVVCFFSYLPIAVGRGAVLALAVVPRYCVDTLPFACVCVALIGIEVKRMFRLKTLAGARKFFYYSLKFVFISTLFFSTASIVLYQQVGDLHPGTEVAHRLTKLVEQLAVAPNETVLESMIPNGALFFVPSASFLHPYMLLSSYLSVVRPEISVSDNEASHVIAFTNAGFLRRLTRDESHVLAAEEMILASGNSLRSRSGKGWCVAGGDAIFMKASCADNDVFLEIDWEPAPFIVNAVEMAGSEVIELQKPVPSSLSTYRTGALFSPEAYEARARACGVRIPRGEPRCFTEMRVTYLKPVS